MNAIVPAAEHAATPPRYGLVPSSMGEAMKLAEMMAGAKLVPAALQKSPADCLMVIQQAIRWDMDPFAVAQECSVIQGKLMHSGKLVAAVVNARGNLTQRLSFAYRGSGDDRTISVSGQLQGEPSPREVEVVLRNAKTANSMWQKQPDQQLMYHGVRVWARRHTPELMLGVYSPEEFDEQTTAPRKPAPPAPNVMLPLHDPDTGEIDDSISAANQGQAAAGNPAPPQQHPIADAPNNADARTAGPGAGTDFAHLETMAREAASRGESVLKTFFRGRSAEEKAHMRTIEAELVALYPQPE